MTVHVSCAAIRARLHALIDGELGPSEQARVLAHVSGCAACGFELDAYRAIGANLRMGLSAASVPMDALAEMTGRVATLAAAEARQSLRSRLTAAFEDMRFVFAGAGSFAATFACAIGLAGILQASAVSRADSLASLMARMAAPRGSTQNPYAVDPRILPPTAQQGSLIMPAILVDDVPYAVPDEEYAFSGVMTSDGRVAGIEMLQSGDLDPRAVELLYSIHESRFKPARLKKDGRAVAVTFLWLHSDVTIKPQKSL